MLLVVLLLLLVVATTRRCGCGIVVFATEELNGPVGREHDLLVGELRVVHRLATVVGLTG